MWKALVPGLLIFSGAAASPDASSEPVSIVALIDRVVLEPSEAAPERIQIWGTFAHYYPWNEGGCRRKGCAFGEGGRGYLYYALPEKEQDLCRKEWAELAKAAGGGKVVAFGGNRIG